MMRILLGVLLALGLAFGAQAQTISSAPYFAYTQTFLSSGSGTIPANMKECQILGIGGGSSGAGGGTVASSGSGGGGGAAGIKIDSGPLSASSFPTLSYSVVIGAGGSVASVGASGNIGGNTTITFGAQTFTAYGSGSNGEATAGASGVASTGSHAGNTPLFSASPSAVQLGFNWIAEGGASSTAVGAAPQSPNTQNSPGAGGAGAGINAGAFVGGGQSPYVITGFASGDAYTPDVAGAAGVVGASNALWPLGLDGIGGSGGSGNGAGIGGNGGAGGQPGGGGGGGGSGTTGGGTGGAGSAGGLWIGCN